MNCNFALTDMFDKTFGFFTTFSSIMTVLMFIVPLIIVLTVVVVIVKSFKTKQKSQTEKQTELSSKTVEDSFITCSYCGSNNDKKNSACKKCGAPLNHNK